jgi:DNA-binding NarL/FixJ family response regulator
LRDSRTVDVPSLLIVDDNERMRGLIRVVVSGLVDAIYECGDGEAALAAVAEHRPDWVLMDIEMPRADGITTTRRIKAAFPAARVVIVTQYDDNRLRRAAREAGADGYVLKESLMEILRILSMWR